MFIRLRPLVLRFALLVMATNPMLSSADTTTAYADTSAGREFIAGMVADYGFEADRVAAWLDQAERQERVLELISRPAERSLQWHEYRDIFIQPERVADGRAFLERHADAFARARESHGVPADIIAAIIGVETWYGRHRGNYRVLDALATLAFDYPPRSGFFRRELAQFFLMAREQGFDPAGLQGSYAGAMGYGQFIASSYRHYAIDFDGDQVADIFDNPVDAVGSVGNYFRAHRWRTGAPVADRLDRTLVPDSPLLTRELRPTLTVADYRDAGMDVPAEVPDDEPARAIQVQGEDGPELWLTYQNFYVITRYNHSHLYALAVHELAQALRTPED